MQRSPKNHVIVMKVLKNKYRVLHKNLIDRCKKGDSAAQFEIYKLYHKAMYNSCLRLLNNSYDAEDVMQEAFLKAFKKLDSFSGEVSFGAWLKRIVINQSLDFLRKRKIDFAELPAHSEIAESNAEPVLENPQEMLAQIRQAMRKLPQGYRLILSLYLLEGYDHDEIAEIFSITPSGSRSQLSRAKAKLKLLLKN